MCSKKEHIVFLPSLKEKQCRMKDIEARITRLGSNPVCATNWHVIFSSFLTHSGCKFSDLKWEHWNILQNSGVLSSAFVNFWYLYHFFIISCIFSLNKSMLYKLFKKETLHTSANEKWALLHIEGNFRNKSKEWLR